MTWSQKICDFDVAQGGCISTLVNDKILFEKARKKNYSFEDLKDTNLSTLSLGFKVSLHFLLMGSAPSAPSAPGTLFGTAPSLGLEDVVYV